MYGKPLKNISEKPILKLHQDNETRPDYNNLALFFLAYSNRILFKAANEIRQVFNLPFHLNTLHIRYLLLIHFINERKQRSKHGASIQEIEFNDFPVKSIKAQKRVLYFYDLRNAGLTIESIPINRKYYKVTNKGLEAIKIIERNIWLSIRTMPSNRK